MKNRKPFFRFCKGVMRIFKRKPKLINYNDEPLESGAIYLTNHSAASGPLTHELYFPLDCRFWGTYEMCGSLKERWNYLTNIYFTQKKHFPKWLSKFIGIFATPVMHMYYKGIQIIPTYTDSRLRSTLKTSFDELNKGVSIIIFPENSSDGYHKELKEYFAGFYVLARQYYKKFGKNLKIYNMYYCKRKNLVIIGKATTYLDLANSGKNEREIANDMKEQANEFYRTYCKAETKKNKDNKK